MRPGDVKLCKCVWGGGGGGGAVYDNNKYVTKYLTHVETLTEPYKLKGRRVYSNGKVIRVNVNEFFLFWDTVYTPRDYGS